MHPTLAAFAKLVRRGRFAKGNLSQSTLGHQVGVTRQTIIGIEQGNDTSLSTAVEIARALDVSLDSLK